MGRVFVLVSTLVVLAGCMSSTQKMWQQVADDQGIRACDSAVANTVVVSSFEVDASEIWVNVSVTSSGGLYHITIRDSAGQEVISKDVASNYDEQKDIRAPRGGAWGFEVRCPAGPGVDLHWRIHVDGLRTVHRPS